MSAVIAVLAGLARAQDVPAMNTELFRPAVDSRFLWVDDAHPAHQGPYGSVVAHYTRDPLRFYTGQTLEPVVHDVAQADLVAGWSLGPARLGVVVPVVARTTGWTGAESGLGSLGLTSKVTLHPRALDLGVDGRLWLPTAGVEAPIVPPSLAGELALIASREVGRMRVAGDLGYRFLPRAIVGDTLVNDVATARLGAGVAASDRLAFTGEVLTQAALKGLGATSVPVEALIGGRYDTGPVAVQAGVGRGLTTAIGSPSLRAVVAVSYTSPAAKVQDSDGDGFTDEVDACTVVAEDVDRWEDRDGCPEPTVLTVRIVDASGAPVPAAARIVGDGWARDFVGALDLELDPASYRVTTVDPAYQTAGVHFELPDGAPRTVDLVVAKVSQQRLQVDGEIHFESGSDLILEDSWALLDGVGARLRTDPSIRRLRIEGHTDDVGDAFANLDLSQRRADAVRAFLIARGVEPDRLLAVGHGESRPVIAAIDESARAINRRVEFYVELWDEELGRDP